MPLYRPAPPTRHPVCDGVPRLARRIAALTCASGRDHPPPRFFFDARPDDSFRLTAARINALNERSSIASPSRMSIARLVLPSRLELKRPEGSLSDAPLAKVSFTTALYVSPVQISPSCDQTGTPLHFHSSTTSGSACLIRARTRESISPRQSSSSSILASMSRAGDLSFAMPVFFMCFSPSTALRRECLHASALVAQLQCGGAALREDLDIRRIRFATEQLTRAPLGRRDLDGRAPLRVDESKQHCLRIAVVPSGIFTFGSAGRIVMLARIRPRSSTISSARPRSTGAASCAAPIERPRENTIKTRLRPVRTRSMR